MNKSITDMTNLVVTCNQTVKLKWDLIANVKVGQGLLFVRDKDAL